MKIRIVELHPTSSWYEDRNEIIGQLFETVQEVKQGSDFMPDDWSYGEIREIPDMRLGVRHIHGFKYEEV